MRKRINLLLSIASLLAIFGCAAHPRVEVDLAGIGSSEIGKIIERNFGNSNDSVKGKINELIYSKKIATASDKKLALEEIGLRCEFAPLCTYHATAKSKLINSDGTVLPSNKLIHTYDITADYSSETIKSAVSVVVERDQN
ncbi:hypothetical protein ASC94_20600 [Massilia sp. Root418]|uniref:hypothetical protein n=1 Tax=Massilia sp. Root418 TaxID=1736532 RepID=UPI0006F1DAB3|nr:hypothetical protein [Massilia sp. Root418]KQW90141.1 hypothetical protein ASC94_20600 [Massilia sp. Root418]